MPEEHDWWTPEHPEDGLSWVDPNTAPRRRRRSALTRSTLRRARVHRRWALLGAGVVLIIVLVTQLGGGSTPVLGPPLPGLGHPARAGDPFAYDPAHEAAFARRAAIGNASVLFNKSPGGAVATAARVAHYRPLINAAVHGTGIDPNMLEGLVFLESAGDPNVVAGTDPSGAAGLTQILASTGQSLLGMHINLGASRRLTGKINAAGGEASGSPTVAALERSRAAIDDRFDPAKALAATVRYLQIARHDFGRIDLAFESYHMGIGNLQQVLSNYNGGNSVPYAQVYFDSSQARNPSTYALLASFGDDSSTYLWRLGAAVQIMQLYRSDRTALTRLAKLETSFASNALVLVPPDRFPPYSDPAALSAAYQQRQLLPLPRNPGRLWLGYSPTMGSEAKVLKVPVALYQGLRPAALDMLIELAARVRALSGVKAPLIVASTVADAHYEARLGFTDPPALTGYTFQIERHYAVGAQAVAFQAMLDRLQSLNLIAWVRGTSRIEITVSPEADKVINGGVR
ncbi:MAG: transglycosylase SLT domain-containing protein [Solirubrobacteraceae bacterium]